VKLTHAPSTVLASKRRAGGWDMSRLVFLVAVSIATYGITRIVLGFIPETQPEAVSRPPAFPVFLAVSALGAIVVFYLVTAAHELGHIGGGALAGFCFARLIVGPLQVARGEGKLRVSYSGKWLMGGVSTSTPTDDRDLRRRMALMIGSGSLVSSLLIILALLLAYLFRQTLPDWLRGMPFIWLVIIAPIIAMSSVWPIRVQGLMTDGALLLALLKGGPQAERLAMIWAMAGASAAGVRPRDRNPAWLRRALALSDGTAEEASANYYAYFRALDEGQPGRAAACLDRILALWPQLSPLWYNHYTLEAAYFEARYGRDAAVARAWLDQPKAGLAVPPYTRLRAEAAVLLAEGRYAEACAAAERGLALTARTFDPGLAQAEAEWLNELIDQSEAEQVLAPLGL
jgi:hypothetical protein